MAKYGRFDPRNKKKRNDKYRSDKKRAQTVSSARSNFTAVSREFEKEFNSATK